MIKNLDLKEVTALHHSEIQQEGVLNLMSTTGSDLLRIRNKNQACIRVEADWNVMH